MTILLLALLISTPDGLPPQAAPAPKPAPTPAAETKRGEPIPAPTPAAGPISRPETDEPVRTAQGEPVRKASVGRCGDKNCLCIDGCVPGACVGGCNLAKTPAPVPNAPNGYPLYSRDWNAPAWYKLGGAYQSYQGYGTLNPDGYVLVRWHCREGTRDVRPGLPVLPQPIFQGYSTAVGASASFSVYATPPMGGCAGGQCGAPGYYYQRGHFGGMFR